MRSTEVTRPTTRNHTGSSARLFVVDLHHTGLDCVYMSGVAGDRHEEGGHKARDKARSLRVRAPSVEKRKRLARSCLPISEDRPVVSREHVTKHRRPNARVHLLLISVAAEDSVELLAKRQAKQVAMSND